MDRFREDGFVFLTPEKAAEFTSCEAISDDLIFTAAGTIGQVGLIPKKSKYARYIISNKQLRARLDTTKADPVFAYYWFSSPVMVQTIQSRNTGSTIPLINLSVLKSLPIPVPPVNEQREIARYLCALDDRITLLRETNSTLEAIAQTLFKSWFVNFDPVRAKSEGRAPEGMDEATAALFPDSFEESALGFVPKGWPRTSLAALTAQHGGSIQTGPFGSQLHASDYANQGTPVVMPKDIADRRISTSTVARVSSEHVVRLSRHQLRTGDIVFSRRGDVERHALVTPREAGWLCGTGCLLVRSGAKWRWPAYMSLLLDAPLAKAWLVQHAVGATMPNLNTGILGSIPLTLPPSNILDRFESVAMGLEERRSENLATMKTLAALRDSLLPPLITGQLRLSDIDTTHEAIAA